MLDAIEKKGTDGARIHFGVGAQTVKGIIEKHGLQPSNYAFFCHDSWDEYKEVMPAEYEKVDGKEVLVKEEYTITHEAGSRYGIRYEELLCFILGAI